MAFLCPVRIRRGKKKKGGELDKDLSRSNSGLGLNHGMGRITGSASIETLVRVGIEKEHGISPDSKMVVLHDFTPCVDDELEVKRGQIVNILYRENDWVYVIGQETRQEGFIPFSYCAPYNTQLADMAIKKKLPRDQQLLMVNQSGTELIEGANASVSQMPELSAVAPPAIPSDDTHLLANGNSPGNTTAMMLGLQQSQSQASLSSEPDFLPFAKDPSGRYIVLYTFIARDENDVSVERGEFVTVLNREDPDWFWIVRSDGQEGFIPSGFVYPADNVLQQQQQQQQQGCNATKAIHNSNSISNNNNNQEMPHNGSSLPQPQQNTATTTTAQTNANQQQQVNATPTGGAEDLRYHGTELVMLYDYKAQAPDDLTVRRGDWIYADLNNQTVDGWLWAYAPKTRKYGFIPKAYARPPAMTSL